MSSAVIVRSSLTCSDGRERMTDAGVALSDPGRLVLLSGVPTTSDVLCDALLLVPSAPPPASRSRSVVTTPSSSSSAAGATAPGFAHTLGQAGPGAGLAVSAHVCTKRLAVAAEGGQDVQRRRARRRGQDDRASRRQQVQLRERRQRRARGRMSRAFVVWVGRDEGHNGRRTRFLPRPCSASLERLSELWENPSTSLPVQSGRPHTHTASVRGERGQANEHRAGEETQGGRVGLKARGLAGDRGGETGRLSRAARPCPCPDTRLALAANPFLARSPCARTARTRGWSCPRCAGRGSAAGCSGSAPSPRPRETPRAAPAGTGWPPSWPPTAARLSRKSRGTPALR